MPDDLIAIAQQDAPFPDADLENIPPALFDLPCECSLASYLNAAAALARVAGSDAASLAGILPAGEDLRYTVIFTSAGDSLCATIAAVPRKSGAREQVRAAAACTVPPALVTAPADIGARCVLINSFRGTLTLQASPRVRFSVNWLRQIAAGQIEGGLGISVDPQLEIAVSAALSDEFLAAVAIDEQGLLRLRLVKRSSAATSFRPGLTVTAIPSVALEAGSGGLASTILAAVTEVGSAVAPAGVAAVEALASAVEAKAASALERTYAAEMSWRAANSRNDTALADASFELTPQGLAAYRAALDGDLRPMLAPGAHVHLRQAALTQGLEGERTLEVHLPFLDSKQWTSRWEALATARVEAGDDGRIVVYTVSASDELLAAGKYQSTLALAGSLLSPGKADDFSLTYTNTARLDAKHAAQSLGAMLDAYGFGPGVSAWMANSAGDLETALTLSVAGSLAAAWLHAPAESAPEYFPVFSRVSVAVQQAMRRWLPLIYFADLSRYEDLAAAYPLVFYRSTRPFAGRPRCDFTYDLVSPDAPGVARCWAARPLARTLGAVQQTLTAAGKTRLARFYAPRRAPEILYGIVKQPRLINALLFADSFIVDNMLRLGLEGCELAGSMAASPARAVKDLANFSADFAATFHRRLRRLYGGRNFVALGSLLLVEATNALGAALSGKPPEIAGTLRIRASDREQVFVNAAYRPQPAGAPSA